MTKVFKRFFEPTAVRTTPARFAFTFGLAGIHLLILITIILGAIRGIDMTQHKLPARLDHVGLSEIIAIVALLCVFTFAAIVLVAKKNLSHRWILIIILMAIFTSRLFYAMAFDQQLLSDFNTMWRYATDIAANAYSPPQNLPQLRALAYFVPIAVVFDGWAFSFQLINAVTITLSAGLVYALARMLTDGRAALMSLLIVAFAPEPLFTVDIATHEIPGTFYLLISIFLTLVIIHNLDKSVRRFASILALSSFLGLSLLFLELARNIAIFFLISVIITILISKLSGPYVVDNVRSAGRQLLFTVLVPYAVMAVGFAIINSWILKDGYNQENTRRATWVNVAVYANTQNLGRYGDSLPLKPYLALLDDIELREFAVARAVSDFADNALARPRNYLDRITPLYWLGSQGFPYYYGQLLPTRIISDSKALINLRRTFDVYTSFYRMFFLIAGLISVIYLMIRPQQLPWLYFPLIPMALLTLALTLMSTNLPRYMYSLWFILPIYIGASITQRPVLASVREIGGRAAYGVAAIGVVLGALTAAHFVVQTTYTVADGRLLSLNRFRVEGSIVYDGPYSASLNPDAGGTAIFDELTALPDGMYALTLFARCQGAEGKIPCPIMNVAANGETNVRRAVTVTTQPTFVQINGLSPKEGRLWVKIWREAQEENQTSRISISFVRLLAVNPNVED